ncbi:MAG: RnfABCDGE type electron transport complex subunit G [Bacteroidales bacterium]|nr:RnfABCDGE type electron transport complex subunit G [Bacteroidales bacterium]
MALQSNLRNMVLVLGITCLLCSGILGGAYVLTKAPIDAAAAQKTERAVAQVLPFFKEVELRTVEADGVDYVCYEATDGETLVGHAIETSTVGFGGDLKLMVGITPDGVVYGTSVLAQAETPGLGAKCSSDERFIRQWQGFDPSVKKLSVVKDGGDVDAITASTITSRAYTLAVARAVNVWKVINGGQSDAVSGASAVSPNTEGDIDYE